MTNISSTPEKTTTSNQKNKKLIQAQLAIILLLMAIIGGLFLYNFLNKKPVKDVLLLKENGLVEYRNNNEQSYTGIEGDEITVANGTSIKTGSDGQAHILFNNNSILSINKNSEIKINFETDQKNINIDQLAGNTWSRVKALSGNESFTINTPTALASVRGTKFGVSLDQDNPQNVSGVYTIESKVGVKPKGDEQEEILVTPMRYAEVIANGNRPNIHTGEILEEQFQGRWFKRNRVIDKWYDEQKSFDKETLKQIKNLSDLPQADSTKDESTKKISCLNILEQINSESRNPSDLEIVKPENRSVWGLGIPIPFLANSYNSCTGGEIEDLQWSIVDSPITASGKDGEIKDLPVGDYRLKITGKAGKQTLKDFVFIKVVDGPSIAPTPEVFASSKSSQSSKSSSSSAASIKPNLPPTAIIQNPKTGTYAATFRTKPSAIAVITYCAYDLNASGFGTDPEDGTLPAASLSWSIDGVPKNTGSTLTETLIMTSCNVSQNFVITLTAKDSKGLSSSTSVTITIKFQ